MGTSGIRSRIAARLWKLAQGVFTEPMVAAAYRGVLGREPDASGAQAYARVLYEQRALDRLIAGLVESDEFWRRQLAARAPEVAQALVHGLLGDDAGSASAAVQAYSRRIRSTDALGAVLADIAHSDEAWQRQLMHHGDDLAAMIFEGVLARGPDDDERERWREECGTLPGLISLLQSLLTGEEFQTRQFNGAQAEHGLPMRLVDAMYRGLLDRPADSMGQQVFAARVKCAGDLAAVASTMRNSREFENIYRKAHGEPAAPAGSWHPIVARIETLYLRHLKRPVEAHELGQYMMKETPVWEVEKDLLAKAPARQGPLRVLLFGAYGNGNMGDAYQALAVRAHLAAHFGNTPIEVSACSLLCSSGYAFAPEFTLSPEAILDTELVNTYDYLVIGGGGLLAHPHDPLADQAWCQRIHTPIILLSVGATAPEVARHRPLLRQALHVIGRDAASVAALATVRPDVLLAADPILSLGGIEALLAPSSSDHASASCADVLWVLKYPANADDRALLGKIREYMADTGDKRHFIVGVEPALDSVLSDQFDGVPLLLTESLDELANLIRQAGRVFSMRYHGAIFALLMDRQVLGASQSKLRDLATRLEAPAAYLESAACIGHDMWRRTMAATPEQRSLLNAEFAGVLAALRLPA